MSKKIIAIVTTLTCAVWMIGSSVQAMTADELQAQINTLLAQLSTLQTQLTTIQGGTSAAPAACAGITFSRTLKQGMAGNDVKCLQAILNQSADTQIAASGMGSSGNETTYFGALTKAAVIKFQGKYASEVLTPIGLTAGTGLVGAKTIAKLNTMFGTGGTGGTTPTPTPTSVPTSATISLAADTPIAAAVAKKAQDVPMLKVKFTAGATAYTVSNVVVARGGVSADTDISSIGIYDGNTRLGSLQALNTTTHKATFSGLSWQIPASSTKYLTVKASLATLPNVGDSIMLGIATSDGVTSTVALGGTFPIWGNATTVAGTSVGELDVTTTATPAAATILSGSTNQEIADWKFDASNSAEGFNITRVKITHVGSAATGDISNIKLEYAGTQLGSAVASLASDNTATFDLSSSPLVVNAGSSKIVSAYADVAPGIWTSRTVIFEITQYTDVTAYGSNSNGAVTITLNSATAFSRQTGQTMTIGQGTLTVALDNSLNPSSQSYVKGTSNRLITALKFSTGSIEGARITQLNLTLAGTSAASTDISNVTLWDGSTQIAGSASVIGTTVQFGSNTIGWDTAGIVDIAASSNKTLLVKADIPTGATTNHGIKLSIAAATDVKADGLASKYDVPSASITGTATGNEHTIAASGALAISLSSTTPVAQTYVKGSIGQPITAINFTAGSGEDISVSAITLRAYGAAGYTTAIASGDITNVKLMKSDNTQYGNTVATGNSAMSFSGNLTVPASSTVVLTVVADIPTTATASGLHIDLPGAGTISSDVTSTGVSSSADIVETGLATGKTMTIGSGALTVAAASTPADQTVIINANSIPYLGLTLTASTSENVRVTSIKLTRSSSTTGSDNDISNIALYDGTSILTTKLSLLSGTVRFSASDFLNSTGIDIAKGAQKLITVMADAPSTATNNYSDALGIAAAADVTSTGLSSGVSITASLTAGPGSSTGVNYKASPAAADVYEVTLNSTGTLTSAVASDTPTTTIVSVGPEGTVIPDVAFTKFRLTASLEDVQLKTLTITRSGGSNADFSTVKLYQGTTLLGSQAMVGTTTFNFPAGSRPLIPKGASGTQFFTIKGDLKGIGTVQGYGSATGDAPILNVANTTDIVGQGVNSGASINGSATVTGQVMYLRMAAPTIAASTLPTSTLSAGTKVLFKWTHSSSATGETAWKKIQFDISGNLTVSSSYALGYATTTTGINGIAIQSGSATAYITGLKVYNDTTNQELNSGTYVVSYSNSTTGCVVSVVDGTATNDTQETIAAGGTVVYRLEGNVTVGGATGDAILTRISNKGAILTSDYTTVAAAAGSLVWSDDSGPNATDILANHLVHGYQTTDWTNDYRVTGIPTTTLTLSR